MGEMNLSSSNIFCPAVRQLSPKVVGKCILLTCSLSKTAYNIIQKSDP